MIHSAEIQEVPLGLAAASDFGAILVPKIPKHRERAKELPRRFLSKHILVVAG